MASHCIGSWVYSPDSKPINLISYCSVILLVWGLQESDNKMGFMYKDLLREMKPNGKVACES